MNREKTDEVAEKTAEGDREGSEKKFAIPGVVGASATFARALTQARQVAPSRATVLLLGETGTGKEVFAKLIHDNSPRAVGPFVAVNCATFGNLLESGLFGHEKGAFTDATERRIGRFEAANGGTLFLDEIGEIDLATQVKLLRFLETRTLERLGSNKSIAVDTRLVCATNRNLADAVAKGTFREDLFYRLSVVQINLPPLRERAEDVPALLKHYLKHFSKENRLPVPKLTDKAQRVLSAYAWPGNVRELRNFCESLAVMHHGETLDEADLEPRFHDKGPDESLSQHENEKRLIREALRKSKGSRTKASELLGISRRTLQRKLNIWPELDV